MRKFFIAFGIAAFLVYCWASIAYQNQVDVPGYSLVEIDILGGMSRERWDSDPQVRFQRLMELEDAHYQLPVDTGVPDADGKGDALSPDRALTSHDFERLVAAGPESGPVRVKLRDTSAIYGLLAHNYILRDPIYGPGGEVVYPSGDLLHKGTLDNLLAMGVKHITVTGHGAPVGFDLGTSIMIAIIFFTLAAALKPVVWEPFMVLLEKRRKELEMGQEAERQNQLEAARFEEERQRRNNEVYHAIRDLKMQKQRKTAAEAAIIVKAAREEEKGSKMAGLRSLTAANAEATERLTAEVPELAGAIADALTPGRAGPRWDRLDKPS